MFATNQDGHSFVSDALKKEFALDWNPPTSKKEQIAKELELTRKQVFIWFETHRSRKLTKKQKRQAAAERVAQGLRSNVGSLLDHFG